MKGYDQLDYSFLERRALDIVNPLFSQYRTLLHLLVAIRSLSHKKAGFYDLYNLMRHQKRTMHLGKLAENLTILINKGYIVKTGSQYRLTQTGLLELQRINDTIQRIQYKYRKADPGIQSTLKKPLLP